MTTYLSYFIEGFLLQASLILALGAQNIFVLESGLKKNRALIVASVCSVCDAFLILLGVLGASSLFVKVPVLKSVFGVIGVGFLLFYGVKKIKEGLFEGHSEKLETDRTPTIKKAIMLSLGFSLLNPHVYLDTLVLIGGYAAKYPELNERLSFGAGSSSFSFFWFFGLALFSSRMNRVLNNKSGMKVISLISGVILLILTWKLGIDVISWIEF